MRKIKLKRIEDFTFEDGCNLYLENCKQRNLREATIRHYKQSYKQIYNSIPKETKLCDVDKSMYDRYLLSLSSLYDNDTTKMAYLRDLKTTLHFLMKNGYLAQFETKGIKVNAHAVETYTEDELKKLLKKPNLNQCSFTEYKCWVMVNFLMSTGVRQRSLNNIKIKDLDLDSGTVTLNVTKNRKVLVLPISSKLRSILSEYLGYRGHKSVDEYLFCNVYGQQLTKSTGYHMLYDYNKRRGVETTGVHRFRHSFAKYWLLNDGSVTALSKLLGHSSLQITENYIHLIATDFTDEVESIDVLNQFASRTAIKMNKCR